MHEAIQNVLYRIAFLLGCHQIGSRSFFVRGRQLPLCARCLGIVVGFLLLPFFEPFLVVQWELPVALVAIFFLDACTQYAGFRQSRNWLRLITGVGFSIGGFNIFLYGLSYAYSI